MTEDLYKIVYCSKNYMLGEQSMRDEQVIQILKTSRKNNSLQNVTGALLYSSNFFAQVLEGPQKAIETIFERIQRDDRHGEVTVLDSSRSACRDFPEWSMARVHPPAEDLSNSIPLALDRAILAKSDAASEVLLLLRTLVIEAD